MIFCATSGLLEILQYPLIYCKQDAERLLTRENMGSSIKVKGESSFAMDPNLRRAVQWINVSFAAYFNRKRHRQATCSKDGSGLILLAVNLDVRGRRFVRRDERAILHGRWQSTLRVIRAGRAPRDWEPVPSVFPTHVRKEPHDPGV